MERLPINYWQTVLSDEEHKKVSEYLVQAKIKNKRDWIKSLMFREVEAYANAIRLHESVPKSEESVRRIEPK